jgi:NTP pyrophosphatase (non-canonical NTP hydrolase)
MRYVVLFNSSKSLSKLEEETKKTLLNIILLNKMKKIDASCGIDKFSRKHRKEKKKDQNHTNKNS